MKKMVVIHQPDFLPYLGFFHRFLYADLWVVFDDVQFVASSRSWHNRDKIKTQEGWRWLTVGVKKCPRATPISEVLLSTTGWEEQNLNLLKESYRKAPFFGEIFHRVEGLYDHDCVTMMEFNMRSIAMLMDMLGITIETVYASGLKAEGEKTERLVDICRKTGATDYLTGTGSRDYLDEALFAAHGMRVVWQEFTHPIYPQMPGDFVPYLSAIDMLFNCGVEESRRLLRQA